MTGQIFPPFTDEQAACINDYQQAAAAFQFLCGHGRCRTALVATRSGLRCPGCGYQFGWVWAWVADGTWRRAGVVAPLPGWWRRYPVRGSGWGPVPAHPDERPDTRFGVGAAVRLRGKPEAVRRVVAAEWHSIRGEFVYVVETSAGDRFRPYWFADQLTEAR